MSRPTVKRTIAAVNALNFWRDSLNPLRYLTMPRAVALMEQGQRGVMADLQWLYAAETGIESTDSDLMTIIDRTTSGVADLDWQIVTVSDEVAGFDQTLADEQAAFLRESYNRCDNLDDAIEHLVMARFRGFAHLQPWIAPDWTIEHLEPLPQWNMVRNGTRPEWGWNPNADSTPFADCPQPLTPDDYIMLASPRSVNRIALIKYVRATTAEKDWDAYVEIYGIPGVFIIMPERVPDGKEEEYAQKASEASEAASGALPHGSDVKTLSEARGTQPFLMRLEWLQKQLVLAGTGGVLTMLAESGSGTLAGGAHQAAWDQIVRRVARVVARPFQTQYERRALAARFPGRPALAYFDLRAKQEKDIGKAVTNITTLAAAGYITAAEQVTAETGYDVTYTPPAALPALSGLGAYRTASRAEPDNPSVDQLLQSGSDALAIAQAASAKPLALAIARVLTAPDLPAMQAAALRLRADLPAIAETMLTDPAQADIYHRIMSSAFLQGALKEPQ